MHSSSLKKLPSPPPGKTGWPWTEESSQLPEIMPNGYPWPKITIVTPSFNQGQFIEQTIRSVLLQGYPNFEYIIIDGNSEDETLKIIRKYSDFIAYWVSEPDKGQSHAINKGFSKATGDILCWLNSDDYLEPGGLITVGQYFLKYPGCKWLVGECRIVDNSRIPCNKFQTRYDGQEHLLRFWEAWQGGTFLPQPSSFFRRDLVNGNLLREDLHYAMDYDLWVRLSQNHSPLMVSEVLANYRIQPQSKTLDQTDNFLPEQVAVARQYSKVYGLKFFLNFEIGWRRRHSNKLFERAFQLKHDGRRQKAKKTLLKAISCYPLCIFQWKVINLYARLVIESA